MDDRSLNGGLTRPLTPHAIKVLRALTHGPIPNNEINPGVIDRFHRENLSETVARKSPYKAHNGGTCPHQRITQVGRDALAASTKA